MEHCMDSSSPSFSCEVYILYICNAKRKTALSVGTLSEVFKENTVMCS